MAGSTTTGDCSHVAHLVSLATTFLFASLAAGTRVAYANVMDRLRRFVVTLRPIRAWFPATPDTVVLFVVSMLDSGYAPASVHSSLSAIAYIHKLYSFPDPTTHFIIRKIMQGAAKLHPQADIRAPITLDILAKLCEALPVVANTLYDRKMFTAMYTLMFHAFLRIGEVTASCNNIPLSQVTMYRSSVHLKFYKYKHHTGQPIILIVEAAKQNCPVQALTEYRALRSSKAGPLFMFLDSQPVSSRYFTEIFNLCLSYLSLDKKCFKPHSFRIGAATHAFVRGVSMDKIQQMGRWKSQAFRSYIRVNTVRL